MGQYVYTVCLFHKYLYACVVALSLNVSQAETWWNLCFLRLSFGILKLILRFSSLGAKAVNDKGNLVGSVIGNQRTFCNLPKSNARGFFHEAINDKAQDETSAHMSEFLPVLLQFPLKRTQLTHPIAMFYPKENPGYYALSESAKKFIVQWTKNEWYESSTGETATLAIEHEL